jgi:hypothetical protein
MKLKTLILLITLFLLTACDESTQTSDQIDETKYRYITIDGMTCISYDSGGGTVAVGGLTCNWHEWNGEKDLVINE